MGVWRHQRGRPMTSMPAPPDLVDQRLEALRVAVVGEARLDAVLRQRVRKQVVGAAVQRAAGDDVVAGLGVAGARHHVGDDRLHLGLLDIVVGRDAGRGHELLDVVRRRRRDIEDVVELATVVIVVRAWQPDIRCGRRGAAEPGRRSQTRGVSCRCDLRHK